MASVADTALNHHSLTHSFNMAILLISETCKKHRESLSMHSIRIPERQR